MAENTMKKYREYIKINNSLSELNNANYIANAIGWYDTKLEVDK